MTALKQYIRKKNRTLYDVLILISIQFAQLSYFVLTGAEKCCKWQIEHWDWDWAIPWVWNLKL